METVDVPKIKLGDDFSLVKHGIRTVDPISASDIVDEARRGGIILPQAGVHWARDGAVGPWFLVPASVLKYSSFAESRPAYDQREIAGMFGALGLVFSDTEDIGDIVLKLVAQFRRNPGVDLSAVAPIK